MRALLVFVASGLGLGAFWRRRRRRLASGGLPYEEGPDPADELRAKLAESKAGPVGPIAGEGGGGTDAVATAAEPSPLDPESRRRDVHARARASIDELA